MTNLSNQISLLAYLLLSWTSPWNFRSSRQAWSRPEAAAAWTKDRSQKLRGGLSYTCPFFPPISTKWKILRSKFSFYVIIGNQNLKQQIKLPSIHFQSSLFIAHICFKKQLLFYSVKWKSLHSRGQKTCITGVFFKGKCVINLKVLISHKIEFKTGNDQKRQRWSLYTGKGTIKGEDIIVQFIMMSCSII